MPHTCPFPHVDAVLLKSCSVLWFDQESINHEVVIALRSLPKLTEYSTFLLPTSSSLLTANSRACRNTKVLQAKNQQHKNQNILLGMGNVTNFCHITFGGNFKGGNFRSYTKEFKIPEGVQVDKISSSYSAAGILTVEAPRVLTAPEGASVQEAMAAKSKAYTTDDGRTAVKEDSSASSQVL